MPRNEYISDEFKMNGKNVHVLVWSKLRGREIWVNMSLSPIEFFNEYKFSLINLLLADFERIKYSLEAQIELGIYVLQQMKDRLMNLGRKHVMGIEAQTDTDAYYRLANEKLTFALV